MRVYQFRHVGTAVLLIFTAFAAISPRIAAKEQNYSAKLFCVNRILEPVD
jgi:hypothetical protein